MSSFINWIATFLFFAGCVFSYKAEPDGYNVTTVEFSSKETTGKFSTHYSVAIMPNSRIKGLLGVKRDATESTGSSKPNQNGFRIGWINSEKFLPTEDLGGHFRNNIALLPATEVEKSPKGRDPKAKKSVPTGMRMNYKNLLHLTEILQANSSGIIKYPTFHAKGEGGSSCKTFFDCPSSSICDILNGKCVCMNDYINKDGKCVKPTLGGSCKQKEDCPLWSVCSNDICVCDNGYIRKGNECEYRYNMDGECSENYECQQTLKYSVCDRKFNRNECRCLPDYIASVGECFRRVGLGAYCKQAIQCPQWSYCVDSICVCSNGYVRKGSSCGENSYTPNFLLALVAGIVFLIVVACLFVIILALKRKLSRIVRNASDDDPPTISSVVDARPLVIPDPSYERVDKPPTYDEAMSSSTTLLTLSVQDIASEPPSYNQVQQQSGNGIASDVP